ncbi:hypothetical protein [uncultured Photobacterium sp.]|uniref:hypothetical protein n=1 Tax=uncultured Photobacterium sp. TaxID=173973 RepID=UPI002605338F|nr:hypothetical protein [uncultured Photobacterium sp.]
MDCEPNKSAFIPPLSTMSGDDYLKQIQIVTLLGRAVEAITVNQVQLLMKGSHNQTAWMFEQIDNSFEHASKSVDERLCFPFDVMDYASRKVTDNWRTFMGMATSAEQELSEQIESQNKLYSQTEKQLKKELAELTRSILDKEKVLDEQQSRVEKEQKAKQTVQRSQRKLKAELEASREEVVKLRAQIEATVERYDQKVSENSLLQTQIKQEAQKNNSEAEQLARKIEAMTAEQEILLAEKDGLSKRIEELQQLMEQPSNYTE